MSFEKLLADLSEQASAQETLSKALPTTDTDDDETIQSAADEDTGSEDGEGKKDGKSDDDKPVVAKSHSLEVFDKDGNPLEVEDGTELVKAMTERLDGLDGTIAKSMNAMLGLIKSQGEMIKSLNGAIGKLRSEGRGRKAVVSVTEKRESGANVENQPKGIPAGEFMTKALAAQGAGRLSALDVAVCESYINRGEQIPANLIQRVTGQ